MVMARQASTAETRLIHYELAGRYSLKAATFASLVFALKAPPAESGRASLHLRERATDLHAAGDRPAPIAFDLPGETS